MNRISRRIGIIPDGNRRWAAERGLTKESGYNAGLAPGLALFKLCKKEGIKELTFYGFTQDNTRRPKEQTIAFQTACIEAVRLISNEDHHFSPLFPKELLLYTKERTIFGSVAVKLNFLVNYGGQWDLSSAIESSGSRREGFTE